MKSLQKELFALKNTEKAVTLQRFFRTGKGEYGEGDRFLGITVPQTRAIAKKFTGMRFPEIKKTLESQWHEERLAGLLILVEQFRKGDEIERKKIFDFYIQNKKHVNNWDLVDLSADKICGEYLFDKPKDILFELAVSQSLWDRRIAIVSTYAFIKKNRFDETLEITKLLMNDRHDLIHKACGWMLRETGKRDLKTLEDFLKKHYRKMPRTMLRYAIEKFPEKKRKQYLTAKI